MIRWRLFFKYQKCKFYFVVLLFVATMLSISHRSQRKEFVFKEMVYNLLEETSEPHHLPDGQKCTLDYANRHKLQQDHPCVVELVRAHYLVAPFPSHVPYELDNMPVKDPSGGQATAIRRILRNQTRGFFVECGASDGEFLSNTLYLENSLKWSGLLIEPESYSYNKLLNRKRKAWMSHACLSLENHPTAVTFEKKFAMGSIRTDQSQSADTETTNVQCFPFYSFMLALNRSRIDYFSLDVEGHELKILKTIPWHKVDIRTLSVEWEHIPEGEEALVRFMRYSAGYIKFGRVSTSYARDIIFVKDFLRDLRYTEEYDYDYD